MKGTILHISEGKLVIRSEDGKKYEGELTEIKSNLSPRVGDTVDFDLKKKKAVEIYILRQSSAIDGHLKNVKETASAAFSKVKENISEENIEKAKEMANQARDKAKAAGQQVAEKLKSKGEGSKNPKIFAGVALALLAVLYIGLKIYAGNLAEEKVKEFTTKIAGFADVSYGNVSVSLMGLNVHIKDVSVKPLGEDNSVNIGKITIYDIDHKKQIPSYLHVGFNEISMNNDSLEEELRDLGYNGDILANLEIDYKYDDKEKALYLNTLNTGVNEMGDLGLRFHIGNINLNPNNFFQLLFSYSSILIHEAKITYSDDSLVRRFFKKAAKNQGKEYDDYIKGAVEQIDREISREEDKFIRNSLESIKDFVKDPDEISISVSPKEPVKLERIQRTPGPRELIRLLNAEIDT